jgi:hypothetical protein
MLKPIVERTGRRESGRQKNNVDCRYHKLHPAQAWGYLRIEEKFREVFFCMAKSAQA